MGWNTAFDYSAILMLILVIIWYFSEKRIPEKSHKLFMLLVLVVLLATCIEVTAIHLSPAVNTIGRNVVEHFLTLYLFVINVAPVIFTYYVARITYMSRDSKHTVRTICITEMVITLLITLLNVFTRSVLRYQNGKFLFGFPILITVTTNGILCLGCIYALLTHTKAVKPSKAFAVCGNIVLCFIALLIQLKTNVTIINVSFAAMCLTLFYYLQNPDAVMDEVTGQFNRKYFGDYITSLFSDVESFGVISIAMDDFKFVNKTYGVDNGDSLLAQVGTYIDTQSGKNIIFRYGADQFTVIIRKRSKDINELADKIHARFLHPWYLDEGTSVMMSASICLVECPRDAGSYGELIEVLDYSMAVSKKMRKGGVVKNSEIDLDKIRTDKAIEKEIKLAMDRDEFLVYYQPIFSVKKNCYNSAEALVRLKSDSLGWISPEDFIPIAEKNGMILDLGDLIFEKVCKFISENELSKTKIEYIEVNISIVQLVQPGFADKIKSIIEKYGVRPEQINIEITETATLSSMTIIDENINALVDYGIKFALDDYGSGYANIDYINRMPFSIIKLDKYIVWDAFKNDKARITLEYTVRMLNALKLYIVAEGVETEEMMKQLAEVGCHYMQGWYYSKAVGELDFLEIIEKDK